MNVLLCLQRTPSIRLVELPVETDTPTPFPLWVELYDLAEDPGETSNVIHDEPQVAKELSTSLENMMASAPPAAVPHADDVATFVDDSGDVPFAAVWIRFRRDITGGIGVAKDNPTGRL